MQDQDRQIIDYIRQHIRQGHSETDIRDYIAASGWPQEAVNKAFRDYYTATSFGGPNPQSYPTPGYAQGSTKKSLRKWLIAVPVVLVLGIILLGAYLARSPETLNKLAKPALERHVQNTARENDVNMIASAIANYISEHSGNLPQTAKPSTGADALDICGAACAGDDTATITLNHYKPSTVHYRAYEADLAVPNLDTAYVVNSASCNAVGDGIGDQLSAGQPTAIILYSVQSGAGTAQKCLGL